MSNLKPCPFCGNDQNGEYGAQRYTDKHGVAHIECGGCSAKMTGSDYGDATEEWNTRAILEYPVVTDGEKKWLDAFADKISNLQNASDLLEHKPEPEKLPATLHDFLDDYFNGEWPYDWKVFWPTGCDDSFDLNLSFMDKKGSNWKDVLFNISLTTKDSADD